MPTWSAPRTGVGPPSISASGPAAFTPSFHVLGRETFLAGVDWVDGWPVLDECRFQVPAAETGFVDTFDRPELDLRWVVPGGEASTFVEPSPAGGCSCCPPHGRPHRLGRPAVLPRSRPPLVGRGDARGPRPVPAADRRPARLRTPSARGPGGGDGPDRRPRRRPRRRPVPAGPASLRIEAVAPRSTALRWPDPTTSSSRSPVPMAAMSSPGWTGATCRPRSRPGSPDECSRSAPRTVPAQVRSVTYQPLTDEGDA